MATLTLNPVQQPDVNTGATPTPRAPAPSVGQSAIATVSAPVGDSVSLSAAAQSAGVGTSPANSFSDGEASAAALSLRHELGSQVLSVTARQNQAIVSLLRT